MRALTRFIGTLVFCGAHTAALCQTLPSGLPAAATLFERADFNHALAFEKMKGFVGTYDEVDEDGKPARIDYTLISRGSALVENWTFANGKGEMTVFHMDKGQLVATHYCASGIQSTMILAPITTPGVYNFTLRSATNLPDPAKAHNSGFGYTISDLDTVERTEIWTKEGKESLSKLTMVRRTAESP